MLSRGLLELPFRLQPKAEAEGLKNFGVWPKPKVPRNETFNLLFMPDVRYIYISIPLGITNFVILK